MILIHILYSFVFIAWGQTNSAMVTEIDQFHISPICSTAQLPQGGERVSLPNTHVVLQKNAQGVPVYRSNSPYKAQHVNEIISLGIDAIVVFKSFFKFEQRKELQNLYVDSGFSKNHLKFIPMPWRQEGKKPFDFKKACEMTVEAMEIVYNSATPSLFHCTVGEDRTGVLAGLLRMQYEGLSVEAAFKEEMCDKGYEAGNPQKADSPEVVEAVRGVLTPLYLKMATLISQGEQLSKDSCSHLPEKYVKNIRAEDLICESTAEKNLCVEE
jgi:hypothetical protein